MQALEALLNNSHGIIQATTGTGKTRIFTEAVIEELKGNNSVVVVLPTVALCEQFVAMYVQYIISKTKIRCYECFCSQWNITDLQNYATGCHLCVTTYATLPKLKPMYHRYSLAIFDECHHVSTKQYLGIWNALRRTARCFGFTATPVKNKIVNMYSCDNDIGGVLYEYGFAQALSDGIVCDYAP